MQQRRGRRSCGGTQTSGERAVLINTDSENCQERIGQVSLTLPQRQHLIACQSRKAQHIQTVVMHIFCQKCCVKKRTVLRLQRRRMGNVLPTPDAPQKKVDNAVVFGLRGMHNHTHLGHVMGYVGIGDVFRWFGAFFGVRGPPCSILALSQYGG